MSSKRAFLTPALAGLLLAFTAAWPATAESDDYFELTPEQLLNTQVISASKRSESLSETPSAVYVVTSEDIARSGVTNIPDALRMVPGVNVAQTDANSWAISIRGFNSAFANKLLVMIDGRTIYNPFFGGVFWEAHDLMLEDIDRIEVVRGPGGTLWGANAVNGVINILTKHSRDTQGTLISGLAGNKEKTTANGRYGGTFGEDGTYRLYAKSFNRDNSPRPGGGEAFDASQGYRAGFRSDWDTRFTLQGDVYRVETDQRRNQLAIVNPTSTLRGQTIKYEGVNILGRWHDTRDDGSQLSIQSYLDWARRDEPFNFVDSRIIYDLETQYNFAPVGRHEVITGAGYRFTADNEKGDANTIFTPEGRRDSLFSVFIQDKITLLPEKLHLTLGSKFEHNEYSGFEAQPNARLQWQPAPDKTLWAAVSKAVRTPTPLETDTVATLNTGVGGRVAIVGNEYFESERLTAYEIGYREQLTPDLSMDLTAFYNDYDQLATLNAMPFDFAFNNGFDPPHLLIPLEFRNDLEGWAHGLEAAMDWSIRPDLKLIGSYSFLQVYLGNDNSTFSQSGANFTFPYHQVSGRLSWNITESWMLDTTVHYVDTLRANTGDSYLRLDMNLGWKMNDNLRFNVVGQNLIGGNHRELGNETDINAAEIERGVFGRFTWEF